MAVCIRTGQETLGKRRFHSRMGANPTRKCQPCGTEALCSRIAGESPPPEHAPRTQPLKHPIESRIGRRPGRSRPDHPFARAPFYSMRSRLFHAGRPNAPVWATAEVSRVFLLGFRKRSRPGARDRSVIRQQVFVRPGGRTAGSDRAIPWYPGPRSFLTASVLRDSRSDASRSNA